MFTIYGGKTEFNQWDLEQRVVEPRLVAGDKVIFLNSCGMTYPMKAYSYNGEVVVDVPNKLLTMAVPMVVYINGYYESRTSFNVVAREKPEGYVFVDNDDWPSDAPKAVEVFRLQDYGIDFYEIYMGGQVVTELDCSAFVADVHKAFNAGKVPYVFFHNMFPDHIPVAVSEDTVAFSVTTTIGGLTRFDVLINWANVHMVATNLGA